MKITLNLDDHLLADAKALAAQQRTSARLPVLRGPGGLVKGVDPLSNKPLLAALGDDA